MGTSSSRLFRSSRSTRRAAATNRFGRLESLETRLAPAIYTWSGADAPNVDFDNANNWLGPLGPGTPGVSDDVVVPANSPPFVINADASHTIKSLVCAGTLLVSNGTFTVTGSTKAVVDQLIIGGSGTFSLNDNLTCGDVQIGNGGTLDVVTDSTLTNLTINGGGPFGTGGGNVTGPGNLTVTGPFDWTAGTLHSGGKLILATVSTTNINGIVHLGRVLENHGTVNVTDPSLSYTEIRFGPSASEPGTINNLVGGVFNVDGASKFNSENAGLHTITNAGTLNHTDAALSALGPAVSGIPLTSTGTINNKSGTLALHNCTDTGTINVTGGTLSFLYDSNFSGPINISAGAICDVDVGTLTCNPGAVVTGAGTLRVLFGTLNVAASTSMVNVEVTEYSTTQVTGAGDLTISGNMKWNGGVLHSGGKVILLAGATGDWSGDLLLGRVIDNFGTVTLSDPSLDTSELQFGASATEPGTINNLAGATFTVDGNGIFDYVDGGGNVVNNAGTFKHTGAAGTATIDAAIPMHNTGTINVSDGVLQLDCPADSSGPMVLGTGAKLIAVNTMTLTAGASVTGAGTLVMPGGSILDAKAAVSISNLSIEGGSLTGAGDVTIEGGFGWTSGTLRPGGKLILDTSSTSTLPFSGPRNLGRVLENRGTVNHSAELFAFGASPAEPGTINNLAGATYTVHTYADFYTPPGGPGAFNNAGTFTFDDLYGSGSVTFRIPFTNTGAVNILAGAMLTYSTIATSGTVTIAAGADLVTTGGTYNQTAGTTIVNGKLDPASNIDIKGGTLRGNGTLASKTTNAGVVSPGNSPGILTVTGNYSQTGTLDVELNGTTAGSQFDQLAVTGTVTLGGSLTGSLGYVPAAGASFVIIANDGTDVVSGNFAGLTEGAVTTIGGRPFAISYKGGTGNDVTLTLKPVTVQSVVINGGDVQRSRVTSVAVNFDQHVTLSFSLADAFMVTRQSDGKTPTLSTSVDDSGSGTTVTLSFTGTTAVNYGSLADGRYTLSIDASKVSNANGTLDGNGNGVGGDSYNLASDPSPMTPTNIFRIFGDATGDGTVAANDFVLFRTYFNGVSDMFDFDGDGSVSASDFIQFRQRFNGSI